MEFDHSKANVLFVDDEKNILMSIKRGLIDEEFGQYYAESGESALQILKTTDIGVLVTDMRMPGMSGLDLIRKVSEIYPEIVCIILSGYAQVSNLLAALNTGKIFRYIVKPWKMESEFLPAIKQAIQYYLLQKERSQLLNTLSEKNHHLEEKISEIEKLNQQLQQVLSSREEALNYLTQNVIPFTAEVLATLNGSTVLDQKSFAEISRDLYSKGNDILKLLRKIEALLNR